MQRAQYSFKRIAGAEAEIARSAITRTHPSAATLFKPVERSVLKKSRGRKLLLIWTTLAGNHFKACTFSRFRPFYREWSCHKVTSAKDVGATVPFSTLVSLRMVVVICFLKLSVAVMWRSPNTENFKSHQWKTTFPEPEKGLINGTIATYWTSDANLFYCTVHKKGWGRYSSLTEIVLILWFVSKSFRSSEIHERTALRGIWEGVGRYVVAGFQLKIPPEGFHIKSEKHK